MSSWQWLAKVFPRSLPAADEFTLKRALSNFEMERGTNVTSLDDLRLFPTFAKAVLGEELSISMSGELAYALAAESPQDTSRKEGARVIVNPSLQVVRGRELKAWYRIDGRVAERRLSKDDAKILDELEDAHGPKDLEKISDPRLARSLIEAGLLLTR